MAKLSMIILAVCIMLVTQEAHGLTCSTVVQDLEACMNYLKRGGAVPGGCCNGVRSLNSAASTTAMRQQACNCLKSAAKAAGVNTKYAAALPKACGVNLGYPISYSTNCNSVK